MWWHWGKKYSALQVEQVFHTVAFGMLSVGQKITLRQGMIKVQFERGVEIWVD
jgi:hypothetical protein